MKNNELRNGVKIMNLEAGQINCKANRGTREELTDKGAIMPNSLLLNKLLELGLKVEKGATIDIVNVKFSYGDVDENDLLEDGEYIVTTNRLNELKVQLKEMKEDRKSDITSIKGKIKRRNDKIVKLEENIDKLKDATDKEELKQLNKDKETLEKTKKELETFKIEFDEKVKDINILETEIEFIKDKIEDIKSRVILTKDTLRKKLYKEGFTLTRRYDSKDKKVHYVRWCRTSSKARVGEILFINSKLLPKIQKWQRMGLELPKKGECKLVEMMSYETLTASSIVDTITIDPKSILVIKDIESFCNCNVDNVVVDENGECEIQTISKEDNGGVKNVLFDGQSIGDESLFTGYNGMMLLRQHMFKSCAFRGDIQLFFRDYCANNGLDYNTFEVEDMFGRKILAKNVKIITTDNSCKFLKFKDLLPKGENNIFEFWCKKVNEDNNTFGICKVEHPSKMGDFQQSSYQHINSILVSEDEVKEICKDTLDYLDKIKNDLPSFIQHLEETKTDMNLNQMLIDMYNHNREIGESDFFNSERNKIIKRYMAKLKTGKLRLSGDNLTIVGNPYAMLMSSIGQFDGTDETLPVLEEGISCYTTRFEDKEELAEFRNPFNSMANMGYLVNNYSNKMKRYFYGFSKNIIAVNMIQTDFQSRNNGSDMDSDFILATNQKNIVNYAKKANREYNVVENKVAQSGKKYENTLEAMSIIDAGLHKAKNDIGISSNYAQLILSYYQEETDEEIKKDMMNDISIMATLAQIAIDNAKRQYEVNVFDECTRIYNKWVKGKKKPTFWKHIKNLNEDKYADINCTMDKVVEIISNSPKAQRKDNSKVLGYYIKGTKGKAKYEQINKVENLVKDYKTKIDKFKAESKKNNSEDKDENKALETQAFYDTLDEIRKYKIGSKTANRLIEMYVNDNSKSAYRTIALNMLYRRDKEQFLDMFFAGK